MPTVQGQVLYRTRVEKGLKRSELAQQCRISAKHIDNLEHGRRPASVEVIHRIAAALSCRAADLCPELDSERIEAAS